MLGDSVAAARVGREQSFRKVRQIQCRVKMVQGVGREQTALCSIAAILHDIKARDKECAPSQSPEKGDKGRICPPKMWSGAGWDMAMHHVHRCRCW